MKEAILYDKQDSGRTKCRVCPWACNIAPDKAGVCCVRKNTNGTLYATTYGIVSSVAADPIEKKPLFHFHPASTVFSLGSLGCNLRCKHCQNWEIAHARPSDGEEARAYSLPPDAAVKEARSAGCKGVAWTYNEPTIWIEYTLDSAKLCREKGLYTVYVTNGYTTEEALDTMGPFLDAYRMDVKGYTREFYKKLTGIKDPTPIFAAAVRAKKKWGMHVEIVTNVIPGWNDDDHQLEHIATWIHNELGDKTPWHVTRFYPYLELSDVPPTPTATLEKARRIGNEAGLKFVYIGNVPGHPGENTYCPRCGNVAIERQGYLISVYDVANGKCKKCGEDLAIVE